mgnify:FL=1
MTVRGWFRAWAASRERLEHRRGYDWAAGQLLRGEIPWVIEAQLPTDSADSFDRGITDALFDWHAFQLIRE